ncbi:MAG: phosphoenolpyruvate--protein phosphotransferase [Rhodospirillales bacterium]|nr:phosphoenolpyruvate--protein phosphotransferase [Rhodospirillales bacterium]
MSAAHPISSTRRLLSRLRDVMAGSGTAQERLGKVVAAIAADLVTEVCSVYLLRAGEVLELFATQGLKPSAVHKTRLRLGEGLIGEIAAHASPLALSDAQNHPSFAFRPETGEEAFHSMMGVPLVREGRVIGVLAVQNRTKRQYSEEELETLETVAMVLSELVCGSELVGREETLPVDGIGLLPLRLEGTFLNGGLAQGVAVLHRPRFVVRQLVAEEPDKELEDLGAAIKDMHGALDRMLESTLVTSGEHRDVLEAYRMIAEDAGWLSRIEDAVRSGLTAPAAVQKVQNDTRLRMNQIADPYFRERIQDLDDLANRLLQHLLGDGPGLDVSELPENVILVARNLGPAELLDYDPKRLRGLILEEGSPSSHVAIIARALDIPVVGRVAGVLAKIESLDPVIVDGDNAQVFLRPGEDVAQVFYDSIAAREQRRAIFARLRDLPAETPDGHAISLMLNAGLLVDVQHLAESGADGIGLYRTEIPFMVRAELPDVESQATLYRKVLDEAGGRPVVFRTLDAGGDKVLPYWNSTEEEENPAMGWRAIRLTLDRPAILRQQLRALLLAGAGHDLRIMFPMIAEVAEFDAARRLLDRELSRHAAAGGAPPSDLRVGAMLEVPSLLFQMPALLKRVDFLSVGSNDLFQFLFASDRGNPRLIDRYDPLSPPVLNALRTVVVNCAEKGVPVSLCGEMGGHPLDAMALLGVGFRTISMSPPAVGAIKAMVRSLDLGELEHYIRGLCETDGHTLRPKLRAYAKDHGVAI